MRAKRTILAALSVLLAACAQEEPEPEPAPQEAPSAQAAPDSAQAVSDDPTVASVQVTLNEWSVVLSRDSSAAGVVAFQLRNAGTTEHKFEIKGQTAGETFASDGLAPGSEITMSLSLEPGVYDVYCPIVAGGTSHRERGMLARLRVY